MNTIGTYEFGTVSPSLFDEDCTLWVKGTRVSLVKVLLKETNVITLPNLPKTKLETSVIVDAMYCIRKWSFTKGENFSTIANSYLLRLLSDAPEHTTSIDFCCDRSREVSLKSQLRPAEKSHSPEWQVV